MVRSFLVFSILFLVLASVAQAKKPNVLFIAVDDLRPELACYGADYIHSPNIDRLAGEGRLFTHHYVQAPTCGASRYALLTGTYGPSGNMALFNRAQLIATGERVPPSLPAWFREHGYTTVSIGKVSHHPGGMGGSSWDDTDELEMPESWDRSLMPTGAWQHPKGAMHALASGEIRKNTDEMDVYQSADVDDMGYPDGLIKQTALQELAKLGKADKPFFLAVGFIRPHLPFGSPSDYMEYYQDEDLPPVPHPDKPQGLSTWHRSGEFMKYNNWGKDPRKNSAYAEEVRKHYAACVSYIDAQIGQVLEALKQDGLEDDTVVVLWGDHGWHLGEHSVWGKHTLYEESLHAPLIIKAPNLKDPGNASNAIVETIDLYPTLCQLAGLPVPAFLDGTSLVPELEEPAIAGGAAASYHLGNKTLRTDRYRLIVHRDGGVELYDHDSHERETQNLAEEKPEVVAQLKQELERKMGR